MQQTDLIELTHRVTAAAKLIAENQETDPAAICCSADQLVDIEERGNLWDFVNGCEIPGDDTIGYQPILPVQDLGHAVRIGAAWIPVLGTIDAKGDIEWDVPF